MAEEEEGDRGSCGGGEEGGTCLSSVCACHVFQCVPIAVRPLDPVSSPVSMHPSLLQTVSSVACSSTGTNS